MRAVEGSINYTAPMSVRPRYHANDTSRDVLQLDPRTVRIEDQRASAAAPSLGCEGILLTRHRSAVADFRDGGQVAAVHPPEIERLILELSGADAVVVTGTGVLRFGERSRESGRLNNSRPARFIHVDCSDTTAAAFAERGRPRQEGDARPVRRFAHYNIWRTFSGPPQDVPLALCDARTVERGDLVEADAVFDAPGQPEWSFEGLVVRYNPKHRWIYFSGMTPEEVLVFKTNDSSADEPSQVPHSAFDDPTCPPGVPPRSSLEMRAIAYWFA